VEGASVGECGRSDPGFVVVASNGAGGRHGERQGGASAREVHDADRFYRGEERAFTAKGHPDLNSRYGEQPRPARTQGEPAADRWTTPCADGGEGEDSTWRGRGLQGPRSAPSLGKKRPQDGARGSGRRCGRGARAGALGALAGAMPRRSAQINSLFEMKKLQKFE
jgi:hypothetical protein